MNFLYNIRTKIKIILAVVGFFFGRKFLSYNWVGGFIRTKPEINKTLLNSFRSVIKINLLVTADWKQLKNVWSPTQVSVIRDSGDA